MGLLHPNPDWLSRDRLNRFTPTNSLIDKRRVRTRSGLLGDQFSDASLDFEGSSVSFVRFTDEAMA